MTPEFTTPCFVRIKDVQQRNEITTKAIEIRLLPINMANSVDSNYLFAFNGWISGLYGIGLRGKRWKKEFKSAGFIDCGTNIPLFLDLAGIRKSETLHLLLGIIQGCR